MTLKECERAIGAIEEGVALHAGGLMKDYIRRKTHKYGKGKLASSIRVWQGENGKWYAGTDLPYAKFVDKGRGDVYPVNAKALYYYDPYDPRHNEDGYVFSKHAGPTKGIRFIYYTVNILRSEGRIWGIWKNLRR